jgi:hypothetical protein
MAEPAAKKHNATAQVAILVAICVVVLNAVFYFLSSAYFDGKRGGFGAAPIGDDQIGAARMQFAAFTVIVGAAAIGAAFAARAVGHAIAAVIGVGSFVMAIYALWATQLPKVLGVTLFLIGALMPLLAYLSASLRVRSAWAFLVATTTTYACVLFFGAPKVRGQLGIGLWTALILPGLLVVATVALTLIRGEYREPAKR